MRLVDDGSRLLGGITKRKGILRVMVRYPALQALNRNTSVVQEDGSGPCRTEEPRIVPRAR